MTSKIDAIQADQRNIEITCNTGFALYAGTSLRWVAQTFQESWQKEGAIALATKIHNQAVATLDKNKQMIVLDLPISELYQMAVALKLLADSKMKKGALDKTHLATKAEARRGYDMIRDTLSEYGYDVDSILLS